MDGSNDNDSSRKVPGRIGYGVAVLLLVAGLTLVGIWLVQVFLPSRSFSEFANGSNVAIGDNHSALYVQFEGRLGSRQIAPIDTQATCVAVNDVGGEVKLAPPATRSATERYVTVAALTPDMQGHMYRISCSGEWNKLYLGSYRSAGSFIVSILWCVAAVALAGLGIAAAVYTFVKRAPAEDIE